MATTQRYTLGKDERLKSRKAIGLLFKTGRSFSHFPFKVFWMIHPGSGARLQTGFGAGTKNFKKAVDRNRIKRLMREAWRQQKNEIEGRLTARQMTLIVFILFTGNEIPAYEQVTVKTGAVLKKLIRLTDETDPANS